MKKLIHIFLLLFLSYNIYSQNNVSTMIKYWKYRDRLKYFVVPGEKQGESQIICVRNTINASNDDDNWVIAGKSVDYGQHGKYTGLYIGVLATEYYLLNKNAQYADATKTQDELYKALNAIKEF